MNANRHLKFSKDGYTVFICTKNFPIFDQLLVNKKTKHAIGLNTKANLQDA